MKLKFPRNLYCLLLKKKQMETIFEFEEEESKPRKLVHIKNVTPPVISLFFLK